MGICKSCNRDIIVKNGHFNCGNCGEQTEYSCWKCKSIITPSEQQPIYNNEKECSWCGYFVCPECNTCGRKKKKGEWVDCQRTELAKIITQRFKENGIKTSIKEAVQILGNLSTGKINRYCPKNVPYTYAKTKNKEYLCLMRGWKQKSDNDTKLFNERYYKITNEPVGTEFCISDKREEGSHGQEVREACNLGICLGTIELLRNNDNHLIYRRVNNDACEHFNTKNISFKVCPRCETKIDVNSEHTNCVCEYSKGKNEGTHPRLKIRITNVSTCDLGREKFKTEVN